MFKKSKKDESVMPDNQKQQGTNSNECPKKDGDNCLEPGVYSDSDPIGGG